MPDDAGILRAAEADRDQVAQALKDHVRDEHGGRHGYGWCDDCASLAIHVHRTRRQVELLAPAGPDMEAMW